MHNLRTGTRKEIIWGNPNRVDIADRPSIVDSRSRIGVVIEGESDCVIGKGRQGVFATLAERKSRLYLALRTKNKTAKETNAAILRLLKHMKQHVMTLTFDNGREFFPKKMPLHKVTEKELFKATDLMNNRPRKCLGYKTPW